jgi:hypothetical protein
MPVQQASVILSNGIQRGWLASEIPIPPVYTPPNRTALHKVRKRHRVNSKNTRDKGIGKHVAGRIPRGHISRQIDRSPVY